MPVWLNGWMSVYELSGCGFESRCSHSNFRFCACFEQRVPWHSGNYREWTHSERVRDMIRTYRYNNYFLHSKQPLPCFPYKSITEKYSSKVTIMPFCAPAPKSPAENGIPKKILDTSLFTQVYQKSWSYAILFLRYGA